MASATETLKEQAGIVKKPLTIQEKFEAMKPQVALALPRHLNPDRMIRIGLTCLRTNPDLLECSMESVLASIMLASQLGLEPGVRGQCFLIPYKKTCTLVPGWLGILDMVNRAGKATAWTGAVYKGDDFEWMLGDSPFVRHRPCGSEDILTHVYAIARVKGAEFPIVEVWSMEKVLKHRDKNNKVGGKHYSYNNFEMYARKVALLQVLKYVPQSIEMATAFSLDSQAEMGTQHLEIKDVPGIIEGTISEVTPDPEAKPVEPSMCGDCRQTLDASKSFGGHHKLCQHAPKEANAAAQTTQGSEIAPETAQSTPKHNWNLLYAKAKEKGVPESDVKMWYTEQYGVESGNDLTTEQFQGVLVWLEGVI